MDLHQFTRSDWTHRISELESVMDEVEYAEYRNNGSPATSPSHGGRSEPGKPSSGGDVDHLKKKLNEQRRPLLRMAKGLLKFDKDLLLGRSKQIMTLEWLLSQAALQNELNNFELLRRELESGRDCRYARYTWLRGRIRHYKRVLNYLELEAAECMEPDLSNRTNEDRLIREHLQQTDPLDRILFKYLFSELWKRSPDEIAEFISEIPDGTRPMALKIVQTFGMHTEKSEPRTSQGG